MSVLSFHNAILLWSIGETTLVDMPREENNSEQLELKNSFPLLHFKTLTMISN